MRDAFKLKFNKEIYEGHGTTETTRWPASTFRTGSIRATGRFSRAAKPGSWGPAAGRSFRIVDPTTLEPVPVGEDGLILSAAPR